MTPVDAPLSDELIESLLYEDEGAALDFKRDPYPFEGADDRRKSELLKDVLAFANAFRRSTAYVLIGVEDNPGGRSVVRGVDRHPDDAQLQQFVNSKTNRPVAFRYRAREFDGKQVGVLEIPVQERPLYLLKDYGKLKAHRVYVRRSSSTDVATPDEIARMGAPLAVAHAPELSVAFGHADADRRLGLDLAATCTSFRLPTSIPDYYDGPRGPGGLVLSVGGSNRNYWRDFAEHVRDAHRLRAVQVVVDNEGGTPLLRGRVVLRAPRSRGLLLSENVTPAPNESMAGMLVGLTSNARDGKWAVVERGDVWEATVDTGTVHPGGSAWTPAIHLGGTKSGEFELGLSVFGENLPQPLRLRASVTLDVRTAELSFDQLRDWEAGSPPLDLLT